MNDKILPPGAAGGAAPQPKHDAACPEFGYAERVGSVHCTCDPGGASVSPQPQNQDVVPWLKQAVLDYEHESYRPSAHYLLLFRGAVAEIERLRAGASVSVVPHPQLGALESELGALKAEREALAADRTRVRSALESLGKEMRRYYAAEPQTIGEWALQVEELAALLASEPARRQPEIQEHEDTKTHARGDIHAESTPVVPQPPSSVASARSAKKESQ